MTVFQNAIWNLTNLGNPPPIPLNGSYSLSAQINVQLYTSVSALSASFFASASAIYPALSAGVQNGASVMPGPYTVSISANPTLNQFFTLGSLSAYTFLVLNTTTGTITGNPVMGLMFNNFDVLTAANALILSAANITPMPATVITLSSSNGGLSINADTLTTANIYVSSTTGFTLGLKYGNGTGGAEGGGICSFNYISGAQSYKLELSSFDPNYEDLETLRLLSLFG